jgi:superfamily II DNA or RNA helicase
MTAPTLRPYQARAVEALRASYASGRRAPLLQLPTGGGKTVVFATIAAGARAKGRRVLVVAHRRELIRQASDKLAAAAVPHGVIAAGFDAAPDELVQVASVQTLAARGFANIGAFDLIVLDEAHHAAASTWTDLLRQHSSARLLGVTATPIRLDGKGLGISAGGPFDDVVVGASVRELVEGGYLAPAKCFVAEHSIDTSGVRTRHGDFDTHTLAARADDGVITGDAVQHYRRHADHKPAIAFCVTVEHAEHVAEAFRAAGYRSACVHGKTKKNGRDALIAGLGNGEVEVLASCELISEGLDVPAVGAVILLRPTKSLAMHLQQIGRGMRPAPGKSQLIVLDHAGNILKHSPPDADHNWSLDGVEKAAAAHEKREWLDSTGGPRRIDQVDGELVEFDASKLDVHRLSYHGMKRLLPLLSHTQLREFATANGYRPGWVFHIWNERSALIAARSARSAA